MVSTSSGQADLEVSQAIMVKLIEEARKSHPRECCGLLLGEGGRIREARPALNVHPAPETHFEIDPQALIDAHRAARGGGLQVIGYYHSHPSGPAEPSATDRSLAAGDGSVWAIIGQVDIGFWLDSPDGFRALSYDVVEA